MIYVANGSIQGVAQPRERYPWVSTISGNWTIDDAEKICATMEILSGNAGVTLLPKRCQFWFKLGPDYFISDSDSDRRAKVLRRTVKP